MKPFEYLVPKNLDDAYSLMSEYEKRGRILAGGTDVLIELRKETAQNPKAIIDISGIVELEGIVESGHEIIIKPLTTHSEIGSSSIIKMHAPLLAQAAMAIGSPQIRNRGTIGGNIMNAAACADTVPPLIALGASLKLCSESGARSVPISEFFVKPYKTKIEPKEILTEIRFTKLLKDTKSAFIKLGRRNAVSISRLSVAAILFYREGKISEARIVPGAAFPVWLRVKEAENVLMGYSPSKELFALAGKKVSDSMVSFTGRRWSTEYKEPVIAVMVRRALEQCV